jgi:Fe2+-dicitrate sensor, membrane component
MEYSENSQQKVNELLIKYIVGSADEDERRIVLAWIKESAENQKIFDELKDYYQLTKVIQKPSGFHINEGWSRVKAGYYKQRFQGEQTKGKTRNILLRYAIPLAASFLIVFLLGFFTNNLFSVKKNVVAEVFYNEVKVPLGAKAQLTLSDGTKVWLNAGSKFRYPSTFLKDTREVYLEGEAFFDVTHNMKKQFVVKTNKINVKVYGTQFNVKSYPEEGLIQTTLVKGSVAIEPVNGNKQIIYLKPNQSATYYKSEVAIVKDNDVQKTKAEAITKEPSASTEEPKEKIVIAPKVDPVPITSWKDTRWIIISDNLGDLAIKLERRYNVKITFNQENLKKYKFSGTLADETFEQVLKIIQLSAPVKFTIDGNHIVFSEDLLYKKNYDKLISKPFSN